jgi:TRAP-type C4-dicarboxylate transport system substrate-binding protein
MCFAKSIRGNSTDERGVMETIGLAGYQGAGSVHTRALQTLAKHLEVFSQGVELTADVTAAGETARNLFDSVEGGGPRHIAYAASGYFGARVPSLELLDLPFTVTDRARAMAALDGPVGERLASDVAAASGLHVLAFWDNGFRHISNRLRPIRSVTDCQGLRVRTLDSAIYQDTLRSFGCIPVVTDVRDLVSAVVSGAVDAQENPLTNTLNFEIWRHHPYVSLTGHLFGAAMLICNAAWFAGLAPHERDHLRDAVAAATHEQRLLAAEEDVACLDELASRGVAVLRPEEIDLAGFAKASAHVVKRRISQIGADLANLYLG